MFTHDATNLALEKKQFPGGKTTSILKSYTIDCGYIHVDVIKTQHMSSVGQCNVCAITIRCMSRGDPGVDEGDASPNYSRIT